MIVERPKLDDSKELHDFFENVIRDTFERNEISNLTKLLEEEIIYKKKILQEDFESNGEKRYFLVGKIDNVIVATIEIGKINEVIENVLGHGNEVEMGTVYVHPNYQKQGLGSSMVQEAIDFLKEKGYRRFYFDSGYKSAQRVWSYKFGKPKFFLADYWEKGAHHMIWEVNI